MEEPSIRRALRARYVFPVTSPPIPDGVVTIQDGKIVGVGRLPADGPGDMVVEDLGNAAILPGLVNAHTHLEFSDLAAPLGEPGMGFVDWVRRVIDYRRQSESQPDSAVEKGLQESVRCGTVALGEIAQPGWPTKAFADAPIQSTVFLELIGPTRQRVGPAFDLARQHCAIAKQRVAGAELGWLGLSEAVPQRHGWGTASLSPSHPLPSPSHPVLLGLSPHASYTVHPDLLGEIVGLSQAASVPLAFHLAESREEMNLLRSGSGPLREFLETLDAWEPELVRPGTRPLDYLHRLAPAWRTLIIHGNYLDDEEIRYLGEKSGRMAVVYCPRTHAWFRHAPYPLEKMLAAGATVALGTDSRASSPDLSVLVEMRRVVEEHPSVPWSDVLALGTIRGAIALGRHQQTGSLGPGKFADLAVVALPNRDTVEPHELLFHSDLPVVATMSRGQRVFG
jgi:cytosine/adenosine deaminase-related metal-dependent hydrolase